MIDYLLAAISPRRREKLVLKELNRLGPRALIEACKRAGVKTFGCNYLGRYAMHIDVRGRSITEAVLSTGSFQFELFETFAHHYGRKDVCFVNVGANIGTSCVNAYAIGYREIIALEPVAENFRLLEFNTATLDADVKLMPVAAGGASAKAMINLNPSSIGRHSLVKDFGQGVQEVEVVRLDDILPARPGVLWIDTEGYELNVLRGAAHYLEHHAEGLCLEITPQLLGSGLPELLGILQAHFKRFIAADGSALEPSALAAFIGSEQKDLIALK